MVKMFNRWNLFLNVVFQVKGLNYLEKRIRALKLVENNKVFIIYKDIAPMDGSCDISYYGGSKNVDEEQYDTWGADSIDEVIDRLKKYHFLKKLPSKDDLRGIL